MKLHKGFLLLALGVLVFFVACDPPGDNPTVAKRIFWAREDLQVPRRDLRCAAIADLAGSVVNVLENADFPLPWYGLRIDRTGAKLYWADGESFDKIIRANLDGSGRETIVNGAGIVAFCLDEPGRKLYWSEHNMIRRANLDGSDPEDVFEHPGLDVYFLAIDSRDEKIYFSELNHIYQLNMDGTGCVTLIESDVFFGLEFDAINRKLYWVRNAAEAQGFEQADPDGLNHLSIEIGENIKYFAIDPAGKIYFAVSGIMSDIIKRGNFDGTSIETLYTEEGQAEISGLALEFE
ncbi:MAG: hypothetical protein JW904_00745 [Spirochaetales bacterium]|nr:hypothetical protein [Spirochaetales bacterium]